MRRFLDFPFSILLYEMGETFKHGDAGRITGVTLHCSEETGVCTACCGSSGTTYCKDGWSESDCKNFSDRKVNGLSWTWHEGQTCAGRGTPATP